jgi:putative tryptophan/tyrosine transport system ATP-binding protein
MIRLENITVVFNKGSVNEITALKHVDLSVGKGEFVVILGNNGSGKSTLLNCIAGSVFPTFGRIYIGETNITRWPDYRRTVFVSRVFQNPVHSTCSELTVLENLRLAALRGQAKRLRTGIDRDFLKSAREKMSVTGMGLENRMEYPVHALSGGQRQALSLVMATLNNPEILILDEPTAALDPRSSAVVMESAGKLIREYRLTALLVTHNLRDAQQYGSRLIQMKEGQIVRDMDQARKNGLSIPEIHQWFI